MKAELSGPPALNKLTGLRVALVHDYLVDRGGAERVLLSIAAMFPNAPIYTAFYRPESTLQDFQNLDVRPLWPSKAPAGTSTYRALVPLFVSAFEGLRLDGYDLVLSSSSGFAKSAGRGAWLRVCMCHTPPRFVWPCGESSKMGHIEGAWAGILRPWLRRVDSAAAARVDVFASNSENVRDRVRRFYGRDSTVIHPPLLLQKYRVGTDRSERFLMVGRLKSYKGFRGVLDTVSRTGARLDIVGTGPDESLLRKLAPATVTFHGYVDEQTLARMYGSAKALIVAGEEDWGMTPLEANACGTPVIAAATGGSLESVRDGITGVLYEPNDPHGLVRAFDRFDQLHFEPELLRAHASSFREDLFQCRLRDLIARALEGSHLAEL